MGGILKPVSHDPSDTESLEPLILDRRAHCLDLFTPVSTGLSSAHFEMVPTPVLPTWPTSGLVETGNFNVPITRLFIYCVLCGEEEGRRKVR